jgi:hypothetical protein
MNYQAFFIKIAYFPPYSGARVTKGGVGDTGMGGWLHIARSKSNSSSSVSSDGMPGSGGKQWL